MAGLTRNPCGTLERVVDAAWIPDCAYPELDPDPGPG
jgi:hypothetical protein